VKLPRDVTGARLVKALAILGYYRTRQTGSHVRLNTQVNGSHHLTVPLHNPIRPGTLATILADVARHHSLSRSELIEKLFDGHER
jgi:predicted RNA binding protein YcfA (HicA-like mRNA interferase family)